MKTKILTLFFLLATTLATNAADLYWIGGASGSGYANYNDPTHWSNTSGGSSCGCTPSINDNVFFDGNSHLDRCVLQVDQYGYCHNMSWANSANYHASLSLDGYLHISGSLTLSPDMFLKHEAYGIIHGAIYFESNSSETITTGGVEINQEIHFNGGANAVWTLMDSLTSTGALYLDNGHEFNMNGKSVLLNNFYGNFPSPSVLDISNSKIYSPSYYYPNSTWNVSASMTIVSTNSVINFSNSLGTNFTGGNHIYYDINFTSSSSSGEDYLNDDNIFHDVSFARKANISGIAGNTFNNLSFFSDANFNANATQTLLGNLNGGTKGSLITLSGGTFQKSSGNVCIDYVTLKDMHGKGGATFYAGTNSNDLSANTGWLFQECGTTNTHTPVNLYWIGGDGSYNDTLHWSTTSGGTTSCRCVPTMYDDVFFDGNSFTTTYQAMSVTSPSFCHNMTWSGIPDYTNFISYNNVPLYLFGSLTFSPKLWISSSSNIYLKSNSPSETIKGGGKFLGCSLFFDGGPNSAWTLQDSLLTDGTIYLNHGHLFNTNGKYMQVGSIGYSVTTGVADFSIFDISNSTVNLTSTTPYFISEWNVNPATTIISTNSLIDLSQGASFYGANHTYNDVNFYTSGIIYDSSTFHDVSFGIGGSVSRGNTFHNLSIGSRGGILFENNTFTNDLSLAGSVDYYYNIYGTQNLLGSLTLGSQVSLDGEQSGTFKKSSGMVCIDIANMQNISAIGGATFYAGTRCLHPGNNPGWIFEKCATNIIGTISGNPLCSCTAIDVPFISIGTINTDNIYTAELSDSYGNFVVPVNMGTLSSTANIGTIAATIPCNSGSGNGYRIRVASSSPAINGTDNEVDITINSSIDTASADISTSVTSVCTGSTVEFDVIPSNGGYNPTYEWKKNNETIPGETNSAFFSAPLNNNDSVICIMTADNNCVIGSPATSNTIHVTVNDILAPSVSITASPGTVVTEGSLVTFTAHSTDGGGNPTYKWVVNGTLMDGATDSTYSSTTLNDKDSIYSILYSDKPCVDPDSSVSNLVHITVTIGTGISNVGNNKNDFSISPNPTLGNFTIQSSKEIKNARVEIYDVLGEIIYSDVINGKQKTVNCNIPSGIYFVKVSDGQKQFNQKLIIQ